MEGGDKPGGWVRAVSVTVPSFPLLDMRTSHVSPAPSCPSGSRRVMEFGNDGGSGQRDGAEAAVHRCCAPTAVRQLRAQPRVQPRAQPRA